MEAEYIPIEFIFTEEERILAAKEGYRRQRVNEEKKLRSRNGGASIGKEAVENHLVGAAGEMAVASYLKLKEFLFLDKEAKRGSIDLPPNIDVKTAMRHDYNLIIQLDDVLTKRYVLVTIEKKTCIIHGWIDGVDAMIPQYEADYKGGRPAYFVPQSALIPMYLLYNLLKEVV